VGKGLKRDAAGVVHQVPPRALNITGDGFGLFFEERVCPVWLPSSTCLPELVCLVSKTPSLEKPLNRTKGIVAISEHHRLASWCTNRVYSRAHEKHSYRVGDDCGEKGTA
jgi:hypothetical protein